MVRAGLGLRQRLGQSPVMTPRLRQAIQLLQMSSLDLRAHLDRELESNPLLERAEAERGDADESGAFAFDSGPAAFAPDGRRGVDGIEDTLAGEKGLRRRLEEQIGADVADPDERLVCRYLIESLDDAGYFTGDLFEIARNLGCGRARVESALARLQKCEPAGVAARSLRECLALQLAERGRLDAPMARALDNLDLVARRDLAALAARCGVDEDAAVRLVREIRSLNPKPGAAFDSEPVQVAIPDVRVRRRRGEWEVALNPAALPRLLVNRRYGALADRRGAGADDRAWVRRRLESANWLLRALDRRAATILEVATELVRRQGEFLRHGPRRLEPLTMREVADRVGLHESTVSRVAGGKFIDTPRGVFAFRYFFSAAVPGADGRSSHAAEAVRQRIRELIDAEPPSRALSDDNLAALLRESGIDVARRTIAKYRESLNIPSSVQRRRRKSARI